MKKFFLLSALACAVSLSLFAGAQKEGGAKQSGPVTIRYWDTVNDAEQKIRNDWVYENIRIFQERNPDIKIEFTNTPNGDQYLNKLSTEMAANNVPDLFMTWTAGRLEPFVSAGRIEPLNDIISGSRLKETVNLGNCSATTFNGKIYAIPMELAGEVLYYNKALFKKHNVKVPETWDEQLTAVRTFRAAGVFPFALANKDPWPGTIPYMAIFDKAHGPDAYKDAMFNKKAVFNTAPYLDAAGYLVQLVKAGAYPDNFNSLEYAEGIALFRTGKAAMRYNGTWELPDHISALGDDLGFMNWVSMPGGKGKRNEGWLTVQNNAYAVSSASKHKAEAARFLEFMLTQERQKVLAEAGFMTALSVPFDKSKLHPVAADITATLSSSPNPILIWDVMLGQNIGKELNLATQAILQGLDPKTALDRLNRVAQNEWK